MQETFDSMVRGEVAGQFGWDVNTIKTVVFTDNNENGAEAQEKNTANYSINWSMMWSLKTGILPWYSKVMLSIPT